MNKLINDKTQLDDKFCHITNTERIKYRGKLKYKVFNDILNKKFLELWPEYITHPKGRNALAKSCFINELFYKKISLNDINREYIIKNINKYNSCCLEYFIEKSDGDVELAKRMMYDRQSVTSLNGFIKKYGKLEGTKKYEEHYNKLHTSISGNNHWMHNISGSYMGYVKTKFGYDSTIFSNYKSLSDEEKTKKRSDNSKKYYDSIKNTDILKNRIERYKINIKKSIQKLKDSGEFYQKFGCWKACYEYCKLNNMEYTTKNRIEAWRILYDIKYIEHWKYLGHSYEESVELCKRFFTFMGKSIAATNCLDEIESIFCVKFEREFPIGNYSCDGILEDKKIAVEFFGDYWHKNPTINRFTESEILDRKKKDMKKIDMLTKLGYNVFVIWENDWNTKKESVISEIKTLLGK